MCNKGKIGFIGILLAFILVGCGTAEATKAEAEKVSEGASTIAEVSVGESSEQEPAEVVPERELTMEEVITIIEEDSFLSYDFASFSNGVREDLDDAVNYYIRFPLEYEGQEYSLDVSCYKETDEIDAVYLIRKSSGERLMPYNIESERYPINRDIMSFLGNPYDIHDVANGGIAYTLPEGLEETPYNADIGLNGGCLFQPDVYEIQGTEEWTPREWKAAGMVSRYYTRNAVSWEEDKITDVFIPYNHSSFETVAYLDDLCAPALLMKASHDLYTVSQMAELEEQGIDLDSIDTTSNYWYVFFAKPGEEMGFVISLNAKNYTKEDMIEFAKSVKY